jgi:hypothetical protein
MYTRIPAAEPTLSGGSTKPRIYSNTGQAVIIPTFTSTGGHKSGILPTILTDSK